MTEMTRASSISLGSEFDDFLFAPIGEDRNGILLSVLSALARLDIDPWQEAASLAKLPRPTATEKLTSLIAALPEPDAPSAHRDPRTIAVRLVALLPRRPKANISPHGTLFGTGANSWRVIIIYVIVMVFMLGGQFIVTNRQQTPARIDTAHAPASATIQPKVPLATSSPRR